MNHRNYQKELDAILSGLERERTVPSLLLHSCCAPCSSYVLEYRSSFVRITVFYYNPNISPAEEYRCRVDEQKRLIGQLPVKHPVSFLEGEYRPEEFYTAVKGLERLPEGSERCYACYRLRLREAARAASEGGFDYFTTTRSIRPLQRAGWLNDRGEKTARGFGVPYLPSDFKKKGGYQRSIELSREYRLYRQDYCGCVFSKKEAEARLLERGGAK